MSPTQLRRAAASLSQLEEEEEKLQPEGTPAGPGERAPVEEQQRAPRAEALQALMVARKQKAGPAAPEEDGTDEEKEHLTVAPTKRHLLDSDEEEEGAPEVGAPRSLHKKKRFQIEDEDEDD